MVSEVQNPSPLRFDGRVAIVTGAGRGIGRETALQLAAHGAQVIVNDPGVSIAGNRSHEEVAQAVADEIVMAGGQAIANFESVADWDGSQRLVDQALQTFGHIDILINAAGIPSSAPIWNTEPEEFARTVGVSLFGTFNCMRHVVGPMMAQGHGRIVNFLSRAGIVGMGSACAYAAAKGGVFGLTNSAARDLEPHDILVNAVNPGPTRTRMVTESLAGDRDPRLAERDRRILNSLQDPRQVAMLALYLGSDACRFAGQSILMDGGKVSVLTGVEANPHSDENTAWTLETLDRALSQRLWRQLSDS